MLSQEFEIKNYSNNLNEEFLSEVFVQNNTNNHYLVALAPSKNYHINEYEKFQIRYDTTKMVARYLVGVDGESNINHIVRWDLFSPNDVLIFNIRHYEGVKWEKQLEFYYKLLSPKEYLKLSKMKLKALKSNNNVKFRKYRVLLREIAEERLSLFQCKFD